QDAFDVLAEVHDDVRAALEAADDARDDLALPALVLGEDPIALRVADALDDHLLGRLGGDTTEAEALLREAEEISELLVLLARALVVVGHVEDLEAQLLALFGLEAVPPRRLERDLAL